MSAEIDLNDKEYTLTVKIPLMVYKTWRGQVDGCVEMFLESLVEPSIITYIHNKMNEP